MVPTLFSSSIIREKEPPEKNKVPLLPVPEVLSLSSPFSSFSSSHSFVGLSRRCCVNVNYSSVVLFQAHNKACVHTLNTSPG